MDKANIRAIIDGATGAPVSGPVADVIPAIVDALDAALNPAAPAPATRSKRVIEADETR
jgi:hypothetical protein